MKHRIYIAGASEYSARADAVGHAIVAHLPSTEIVSRWHRQPIDKYPVDASIRAEKLAENIAGIMIATHVVMLADLGTPRTSWAEVGFAIARKIPVIWARGIAPEQQMLFDVHASVTMINPGGVSGNAVGELIAHRLRSAA